ncbi:hypothetical protein WGH24286_01730 [Periweissella ghanensis]|uniref:Uncharacterized protein n=1 Tax=Periweissella ghanensis TaxID=467997 RepID=A0ABM8ZDF9_9LACO|nr:hypothetical protein WGH24286_01730 [Periweissella ghanensis]
MSNRATAVPTLSLSMPMPLDTNATAPTPVAILPTVVFIKLNLPVVELVAEAAPPIVLLVELDTALIAA